MDPTAIDDHHDLFAGFAEGRHHLMDILAQLLGIKMGHDFIEDFGGPILDSPKDAEQHPAGDAAPGAILHPCLAFEGFFAFDLALAERTVGRRARWACAPPARAGEGKAPQDRFIFIEQNDLAAACLVLEGSKFDRAIGEVSWGGIEPPGGATVAYVFFLTRRGHFRGQVGRRFRGPRRSRVRGNSTGNGGSHAGGGLDRRGD